MRALRSILAALLMLALAGASAGCGATPPQAPLAQAKKLDASLGAISAACGLSYQLTAFSPAAALTSLESRAAVQARKLASVYARDPGWIYQGQTVRTIVKESSSLLGACGLTGAATALRAATHR